MNKFCSHCKLEKSFEAFSKDSSRNDGLNNKCRSCAKIYRNNHLAYYKERDKIWAKENAKQKAIINQRHYNNNKELFAARSKKYRDTNSLQLKEKSRNYYQRNKETIKKRANGYYHSNKEIIIAKQSLYCKIRRQTEPLFKLTNNLRRRLIHALNKKRWHKNSKFNEYIGCNLNELKNHLETQFQEGMNWQNQGKWHIDHVIPLSSANTEEELYKLCHYTNLQPLWAVENIRKGNKNPEARLMLNKFIPQEENE
jgi:hypothetical protein